MPTAFVYSPFTGWVSQGPGGGHIACTPGISPVDVAGVGTIRLYVNYPTVKKVYIQEYFNCCAGDPGAGNNHRRLVKVDLYDQNTCWFGAVFYGHLTRTVGLGWITLTSSSLTIGATLNTTGLACYQGIHVHMERTGGSTHVSTGTNLTAGTTTIYSWNNCIPA